MDEEIERRIGELDRLITGKLAVYESNALKLRDIEESLARMNAERVELEELNEYFSRLISDRREGLISKVLAFVSQGMQAIFEDPSIEVLIEDSIRSGRKYTRIGVSARGVETWDWSSASGGMRQAVSFLFRVIFLSMSSNRRFLVLDEPFSALSAEYRENMASLIKSLARDMDMQFLIVTHQPEIREAATNLFEIRRDADGAACIAEV